jgi:hypothetical protein
MNVRGFSKKSRFLLACGKRRHSSPAEAFYTVPKRSRRTWGAYWVVCGVGFISLRRRGRQRRSARKRLLYEAEASSISE